MTDLYGFAERIEVAYSGFPHVDEEVALLCEQMKLLVTEHIELRRQVQAIHNEPTIGYIEEVHGDE